MKADAWYKILRAALSVTTEGKADWQVRRDAFVLSGRTGSLVIRPSGAFTGVLGGHHVEFLDPEGNELGKVDTGAAEVMATSGFTSILRAGQPTGGDILEFGRIVDSIVQLLGEKDMLAERIADDFSRELLE
jgi:hypothetical protein